MLGAFLVLGFVITIVPYLLQKLHIDVRGGEVLLGMAAAFIVPTLLHQDWFSFVAELGLLVLMFEIGLDIDIQRLQEDLRASITYGMLAFGAPFVTTFLGAVLYIGDFFPALILATGLSSSALAVIIPTMRRDGIDEPLLQNAAMFSEMIGITLLMAFARAHTLQTEDLFVEAATVVGFFVVMVFIVPRLMRQLHLWDEKEFINFETKFMLFIVLAIALLSEQLGIHAATGAFLAGLFLSESTHKGLEIEERITPITELLVPVFFFHIGYQIQPSVFSFPLVALAGILAVIAYVSRYVAFRTWGDAFGLRYDMHYVNLLAPCMTITATAAQIGADAGLFSASIFGLFLLSGLILTVAGPFVFRIINRFS